MKTFKNYLEEIEGILEDNDVDEGLVPFDLYDFQEDIATTIANNRFTIIKTPRQAGKTTIAEDYHQWKDNYNKGLYRKKYE